MSDENHRLTMARILKTGIERRKQKAASELAAKKVIIPYRITRKFIKDNRDKLIFIYGDALKNRSYEGQCYEAKGEPNAFMVPTKWNPCSSELPSSFFFDKDFDLVKFYIDEAIKQIPRDNRPIIVFPKIGCGRAKMPEKCPKIYRYLMDELEKIKWKNVEVDYRRRE